jgi:hypothetical protein
MIFTNILAKAMVWGFAKKGYFFMLKKLKNNPFLLKSNLLKIAPMAPMGLRSCVSEEVGQFIGPTKLVTKPPNIVYFEDTIRSTFYRDHPYELNRPRLVYGVDFNVKWSSIRGDPQVALNGECVVQRTVYLHKESGMPLENAYEAALHEFYEERRKEEERERQLRNAAIQQSQEKQKSATKKQGKIPKDEFAGRPYTKFFVQNQEKEIAKAKQSG